MINCVLDTVIQCIELLVGTGSVAMVGIQYREDKNETPIESLLRRRTRHWTSFARHSKTQILSWEGTYKFFESMHDYISKVSFRATTIYVLTRWPIGSLNFGWHVCYLRQEQATLPFLRSAGRPKGHKSGVQTQPLSQARTLWSATVSKQCLTKCGDNKVGKVESPYRSNSATIWCMP